MQTKPFSIVSRIKSFKYAANGIVLFIKTQHNVWIQIGTALIAIGGGIYFNINTYEWCLLSLAIALVFTAELFNTAIEFLVNFISPEYNDKAGKIKDIAAGGVLMASAVAAIIGSLIFLPRLMSLFH